MINFWKSCLDHHLVEAGKTSRYHANPPMDSPEMKESPMEIPLSPVIIVHPYAPPPFLQHRRTQHELPVGTRYLSCSGKCSGTIISESEIDSLWSRSASLLRCPICQTPLETTSEGKYQLYQNGVPPPKSSEPPVKKLKTGSSGEE